jgi:6-phosphofructokinase 1
MTAKRRIGILTGGGDVPGLNVAIKPACENGDIEVVGLRRGWLSVVQINPDDPKARGEWTMPLTRDSVRTIDRTGGTILHTSRINPAKVSPNDVPACVRAEDRDAHRGAVDCTPRPARAGVSRPGGDHPIGGDDTLSRRPPQSRGRPDRRYPQDDGQRRVRH